MEALATLKVTSGVVCGPSFMNGAAAFLSVAETCWLRSFNAIPLIISLPAGPPYVGGFTKGSWYSPRKLYKSKFFPAKAVPRVEQDIGRVCLPVEEGTGGIVWGR